MRKIFSKLTFDIQSRERKSEIRFVSSMGRLNFQSINWIDATESQVTNTSLLQ